MSINPSLFDLAYAPRWARSSVLCLCWPQLPPTTYGPTVKAYQNRPCSGTTLWWAWPGALARDFAESGLFSAAEQQLWEA